MKNYKYGLRAEDRLAGAYSRRGHTTSYYERSRGGAADIVVVRGGRRMHIQVKSIRSRTARIADADAAFEALSGRMSDSELARLVKHAWRSGGQPVVGLTHGDYYWAWRIGVSRDEYGFDLLHHGWLPKRALQRDAR